MGDLGYTIFGSEGHDHYDDDPDYIPDEIEYDEDDADEEAEEQPTAAEEEDGGPIEGVLTGEMIAGRYSELFLRLMLTWRQTFCVQWLRLGLQWRL